MNRLFFLIWRGPLHEAHKYGMIRPRQKIASRNVSYTFFYVYYRFIICLDLIQTETGRIAHHVTARAGSALFYDLSPGQVYCLQISIPFSPSWKVFFFMSFCPKTNDRRYRLIEKVL